MSTRNFAAAVAATVFLLVLVCGNLLVRTHFPSGYIPDPYSFLVVLVPPFPLAFAAYKWAMRRRPVLPAA